MDYPGDEPQEFEQIPWSHLVPIQKDRTAQLALIGIAALAALLAVVFLMRGRSSPSPTVAQPAALPPVTTVGAIGLEPAIVAPLPDAPAADPAAEGGPRIYSEADLMAVLPPPRPDLELMAIARAEWFVTDYFTIDGDPGLAEGVAAAMPDAVDLPVSDGSQISYVEWARAVDAVSDSSGAITVTVWFRTLVGDGADGFTRTAVRAVDVAFQVDETEKLVVTDVPILSAVEPLGIAAPWPDQTAPPGDVVAAAAAEAAGFGADPTLIESGRDDVGWRLVFSVGDASGLRFPIVVRMPPGR